MLEQLFLQVLHMSQVASIVILIVIIARILLKRFPKFLTYMLWLCVIFRLLCPFVFEVEVDLIPEIDSVFESNIDVVNHGEIEEEQQDITENITPQVTHEVDGNKEILSLIQQCIKVGAIVWLLGAIILFLYAFVSFLKIQKNLKISIPLRDNIYLMNHKVVPFAMGVIHPKIYISEGFSEKEQEFIIRHEKIHIRRLDHIVKLIAYVALCIHWFNPLVWIAFLLCSKDMEMSCDEAVIKEIGESEKADYATLILSLSIKQRMMKGISVAFAEGDIKGRVCNLMNIKRRKRRELVCLISGVIVLMIFLLMDCKAIGSELHQVESASVIVEGDSLKLNDFENLSKAAEQIGFHFRAVEDFTSNNYMFANFTIKEDIREMNDIKVAEPYSQITIKYGELMEPLSARDGDIYITIFPYDGGGDVVSSYYNPSCYVSTKQINGIDVHLAETIHYVVASDYVLTEEDKEVVASGKASFNTSGDGYTDTTYYRNVYWVEDGIYYGIRFLEGDYPVELIEGMVEEIIEGKLQ